MVLSFIRYQNFIIIRFFYFKNCLSEFLRVLAQCTLTLSIKAHKILVSAPFNGKSYWIYMSTFVKELLNRGHEVTTITSISMSSKLDNYTEILIDPPCDWLSKSQNVRLKKRDSSIWYSIDFMDWEMGLVTPISHFDHVLLPYTDKMNFFQRWYNLMLSMHDWFIRETFQASLQTELLKNFFFI